MTYPAPWAYPPGCGVSLTRRGSTFSTKDTPVRFSPSTTFEHNSVEGKERRDYDGDESLRLALAHLLQVISEAARRVSKEFWESHPEIPWKAIIGMRHKVVHDYMDVDEDVVWDTVTTELGPLVDRLKRVVPAD